MGGTRPHRLRFPWRPRSGHGSHGRTMYYSPGQERPPAGGPVQENPGKKTAPPAGDAAGGTGPVEVCELGGAGTSRPPSYHRVRLFGVVGPLLRHQHSQHTTGYGPCQGSAGRIVGHFDGTRCRVSTQTLVPPRRTPCQSICDLPAALPGLRTLPGSRLLLRQWCFPLQYRTHTPCFRLLHTKKVPR